ncbi:MAG: hypothetical protein BWY74_03991 [Firmicutes bacterium ADurb.Bin419]|nr:MAG: hypothetical protein BWY74_03991 [Firmicutes bacterium ADurb.Bin419]
MKFVVKPANRFELGFCNACNNNCHNDCGTQTGCGYDPNMCGNKR